MKTINIDDELYQYIASNTQSIGEDASTILRRLLNFPQVSEKVESAQANLTQEKAAEKTGTIEVAREFKLTTEQQPVTQPKKPSDDMIAHISRQLQKLIGSADFLQEDKQVNRFLSILSVLYRANPEGFANATEVSQGRSRVYFSLEVAEIEASGSSVNPKQIPKSPFWVATNNNTGRKLNMLESVMRAMYIPENLIELVAQQFTSPHTIEGNI
ncbi:replication initiation regulator SeqA [Gallibacterium genomosp. 3]|uniref:Negative modulator of initiation of replication n=1 Tax=Gallibacterium genomosp. 3 TaxID=505345 RepID=A0A1A7PWA3_9PAST|nr:replication initiation negative regulator SeqA [Gallibacterium genomosp. 3]OBX06002.1 replication initiation regulator SeqA [Gallibacterium genomosp. 3]